MKKKNMANNERFHLQATTVTKSYRMNWTIFLSNSEWEHVSKGKQAMVLYTDLYMVWCHLNLMMPVAKR